MPRLLTPLLALAALLVVVPAASASTIGATASQTVEPGPKPGVQRILDITGLVPVLPVIHGREEAITTARSTNGTSE